MPTTISITRSLDCMTISIQTRKVLGKTLSRWFYNSDEKKSSDVVVKDTSDTETESQKEGISTSLSGRILDFA